MPYIRVNDQDIEVAPFDDLAIARQFSTEDKIILKKDDQTYYVVDKQYEEDLRDDGYEKV